MKAEAQRLSDDMGDGTGRWGSILEGGGDLLGCLGEVAFKTLLKQKWPLEEKLEIEHLPNRHYDLDVNRFKIDVKSKWAKTTPQKNWEGTVAMGREDDSQLPQNVDVFAFMRILYQEVDGEKVPDDVGWFIGWLFKTDFYKIAMPIRKGEVDQRSTNTNQFKSHKDQWNVYHYQMNRRLTDLFGPELF